MNLLKKLDDQVYHRFLEPPPYGIFNQSNRDTWIKNQLTSLPAGLRLLDVGAGECPYKPFCGHLEYVAQDVSVYDGTGNAEGLQTKTWDTSRIDIVCDILDFPEGAGKFDAILCSEVIEHVPDPVQVIYKLTTLLRPGGTLILTAPFISFTHFAPFHFATGFNRYFYEHHLPLRGMQIVSIEANGNFFELAAQELQRIPVMLRECGQSRIPFSVSLAIKFLISYIRRATGRIQLDPAVALSCYGLMVVARLSNDESR